MRLPNERGLQLEDTIETVHKVKRLLESEGINATVVPLPFHSPPNWPDVSFSPALRYGQLEVALKDRASALAVIAKHPSTLSLLRTDPSGRIPLDDQRLAIACPACGAATNREDEICPGCGVRLADAPTTSDVVLFACVHNAGRSQMAAAVFNLLVDPERARAVSAGTEPAARVHPEVVEVMAEVGIDLRRMKPAKLTGELASTAARLVTMGCGEACPAVPGLVREDWPLPDPKGQSLDRVREIRNDVTERVLDLARRNNWMT